MIQIFFAATQYAAATVTAAVRAGLFGPREGHRRLLVVSNTSAIPELTTPLDRMAGFEELRPEFDAVHFWNETVAPHHPVGWSPREQDLTLWERSLRLAWDLGDEPVEIACESLQANPSRAAAEIFAESTIHVYADGLMSYGPTRDRLPGGIACRIARLLHLDLLPGLRPLLLSEYEVEAVPIPVESFLRTLSGIGAAAPAVSGRYTAVLLGQYLSALDLISEQEEEELHARILRGAVAAGHTSVLFKPHPSAPAHLSRSMERAAAELGAELAVLDAPVLAETLFERDRPELVVGCFSTALVTAASFYGIPVARVGTELLLERISPYENSNRVPLTLIDAALPDLERDTEVVGKPLALTGELVAERLAPLIRTVGYCMQARAHPGLRPEAEAWLTRHQAGPARYFKRRRLTSLRLPGGAPVRAEALRRHPAVRRIVRTLRAVRS
ncbi:MULTISPECIES: polysialyltransferase family glycosyltransferase [unclassified Streptomyces]|uniref:polysialyltransferase family glycosyltransferase n=1 Tax=unclassified Streptomyces TaxID=2593676 RepID=UPI003823126F